MFGHVWQEEWTNEKWLDDGWMDGRPEGVTG
jgi:hypothetical protein